MKDAHHAAAQTATPVDRMSRLVAVRQMLRMISGRWKLEILCLLRERPHRFSELRRGLAGVTPQMLTVQLRELEADGLILRHTRGERPVQVSYIITPTAERLDDVMDAGLSWWRETGSSEAPRLRQVS